MIAGPMERKWRCWNCSATGAPCAWAAFADRLRTASALTTRRSCENMQPPGGTSRGGVHRGTVFTAMLTIRRGRGEGWSPLSPSTSGYVGAGKDAHWRRQNPPMRRYHRSLTALAVAIRLASGHVAVAQTSTPFEAVLAD